MDTCTWYSRFPAYLSKTNEHIGKIESRENKDICVPYSEDRLKVERISEHGLKKMGVSTGYAYSGKMLLSNLLLRLQYIAHFNIDSTEIKQKCGISIPILGQETQFMLEESTTTYGGNQKKRGWQILIFMADGFMPTYDYLMKKLMLMESRSLAKLILTALDTSLDCQKGIELSGFKSGDIFCIIKFILLTHVAEAAIPSRKALNEFEKVIENNKQVKSTENRTPSITTKHGRIPMMDKIVRAKLRNVITCKNGATFVEEFSESKFPIQQKEGTRKARERALTGYENDYLSDFEDDLQESFEAFTITEKK